MRAYLQLIRPGVTVAVSLSALASGLICSPEVTSALLMTVLAVALLAAGASALNQYQEWEFDEKMERTRKRPIPSRRLSTGDGLRVASTLLISGYIVLILNGNLLLFSLGMFNVIWYNGVYTFLKRKTAFAVLPGALTGAVPVLMGWISAGGKLNDPLAVFLSAFIFIWQMPHFWLILMKYKDEYKAAGLPVLSDFFSPLLMKLIILSWLLASTMVSVYLAWTGINNLAFLRYVIALLNLVVLLIISRELFLRKKINFPLIFFTGNSYIFIVLICLIADKF